MVDERGTQARPVNDAGMTGEVECRYYGRDFTSQEMALLRALIAASPPPNRYALSTEFCRRIGWVKPDGGLKDMMARVTMLAMYRDGLITLPPPRWGRGWARPITFTQYTEPPLAPVPTTLDDVRPLSLQPVVGKTREGKRWNEFIARYHYTRLQDPGGRPDALRRPRPRRLAHRHARLQHRGMEAGAT